MVDLTKDPKSYDRDYFKQIEKEVNNFPEFLALQKKYVEVGELLNITEGSFCSFSKKWSKIRTLTTSSKEIAQLPPPLYSEKEKDDLLKTFMTNPIFPHSPSEVFTIF